jgi:SAM-dependent methyltransferase
VKEAGGKVESRGPAPCNEAAQQERYAVYDPFAEIYDRHWGAMFCDEAREGFQNLLLPLLPHRAQVLDLCCGTGQLAHWLSGCGFRVTGLDGSAEMIERARRNAPHAKFVVADARSFQLPDSFDLVISTFDSLNHLATEGELRRVFSNVHAALRGSGIFFFDMNMEAGFRYTWNDKVGAAEADSVFLTRADYDPKSKTARTSVTLFRPESGAWRRHDIEIVEYCYPEEAVRLSLARAGFTEVVAYDADTDIGMSRGHGRLFFLTAKGALPPPVARSKGSAVRPGG